MSKKHFVALAATLRNGEPINLKQKDSRATAEWRQWRADVERVALVCMTFNPNFDRQRFLSACGIEESK